MNKDAKYTCTPLILPTPTDETIIMCQLKPFKHYIYSKDEQLDGMNNTYDNNVFSMTLPSLRSNKTIIWI